jgi:hypothetical protein
MSSLVTRTSHHTTGSRRPASSRGTPSLVSGDSRSNASSPHTGGFSARDRARAAQVSAPENYFTSGDGYQKQRQREDQRLWAVAEEVKTVTIDDATGEVLASSVTPGNFSLVSESQLPPAFVQQYYYNQWQHPPRGQPQVQGASNEQQSGGCVLGEITDGAEGWGGNDDNHSAVSAWTQGRSMYPDDRASRMTSGGLPGQVNTQRGKNPRRPTPSAFSSNSQATQTTVHPRSSVSSRPEIRRH